MKRFLILVDEKEGLEEIQKRKVKLATYMVAEGLVVLKPEILDRLLKITDDERR